MVTTAGKPSGIAATATATEVIKFFRSPSCRTKIPIMKIIAVTASTNADIILPSLLRLFSSGVFAALLPCSIAAILPISVSIPTAVTTAEPLPRTTKVEPKRVFVILPSATLLPRMRFSFFSTAALSPVSAASSHASELLSITRQSAGTTSPSSNSTTSPTVKASHGITNSLLSRRTLQNAAESFFRFSIALSARNCCIAPTSAFIKIMTRIITVSVKSFLSLDKNAISPDTAAAAISSIVIKSLN